MGVPNTSTFSLSDVEDLIKPTGIGDSTFTGSGNNDLSITGAFSGNPSTHYRIHILAGDPTNPNIYRWSDTGGSSWNGSPAPAPTSFTHLNNGVYIEFGSTTGHVTDDRWDFRCDPSRSSISCFRDAIEACFDPTYKGDKDRLYNFRNYGVSGLQYDASYHSNINSTWGGVNVRSDNINKRLILGAVTQNLFLTGGIAAFSSDGSSLTRIAYDDDTEGVTAVSPVSGTDYIITARPRTGISMYKINGSAIDFICSYTNTDHEFYEVYYDKSNDYVWGLSTYSDGHSYLTVVEINGTYTAFNWISGPQEVNTYDLYSGNNIPRIWGQGTGVQGIIYLANWTTGVQSYHVVSGVPYPVITEIDTWPSAINSFKVLAGCIDASYVYISGDTSVYVLSHDGEGNMTYVNKYSSSVSSIIDLTLDASKNLLLGCKWNATPSSTDGLYIFKINKNTGQLSLTDYDCPWYGSSHDYISVATWGEYEYVLNSENGILVYEVTNCHS